MTRRLAGYDLNGWRDHCARSWLERPGEDPVENSLQLISGGLAGRVVPVDGKTDTWIGGYQAQLAPEGRGAGWGTVGATRCHSVRTLMQHPFGQSKPLGAALSAMAPAPQIGVLAIPDCANSSERHQEAWLDAMRQAGVRQPYLVWRPVLAVLGALDRFDLNDMQKVGIISQQSDGIVTQVLTLRQVEGLIAPERRSTGQLHRKGQTLETAFENAVASLRTEIGPRICEAALRSSATPAKMTLGITGRDELIRKQNGDWVRIAASPLPQRPEPDLARSVSAALDTCDIVFLECRLDQDNATALFFEIASELGPECHLLPADCVAKGALAAAERLSRGQPVFYDFLPQVATLVEAKGKAKSWDLVPKDEVLPAGQLYRSKTPAKLALMPGQEEFLIFLNKETESAPRQARVPVPIKVEYPTEVLLTLEQQPAAGRARLILTSTALPAPVPIDFEAAAITDESWDALIETHSLKPPIVPDRLVRPCSADIWRGVSNRMGLSEFLEIQSGKAAPEWPKITNYLSSHFEGNFAINSDGFLPPDLPPEEAELFDDFINEAEYNVLHALNANTYKDNKALRFLTWTARRCPPSIAPHLISALTTVDHPIRRPGWTTLVWQGLGRILEEADHIEAVLTHMMSLPDERWKKDQVACLGFLLSRTDTAPKLLNRDMVDRFAEVAANGLRRECGGDYTSTFIYFPIVLVGLLRWRLIHPNALTTETDKAANLMAAPLEAVIEDLRFASRNEYRLARHLTVLEDARDALSGAGGHSQLLSDLFNLT